MTLRKGKEKLQKFAEQFIEKIKDFALENDLQEIQATKRRLSNSSRNIKRSGSTYDETRQLVNKKLSLAEIAKTH